MAEVPARTTQSSLSQQIKALGQARTETLEQIGKSHETITRSENTLAQSFTAFTRQQAHALEQATDALDNMRTASRLPRVIQRVMGIFDEDYNIDAQRMRIEQQNLSLQAIGQNLQIAETMHGIIASQAGRQQEHALRILQFNEQGFLDSMRAAEFGIRLQEHELQLSKFQREKLEKDLSDRSVDEIAAWVKDPSKAPAQYRDKPGLLRAMQLQKISDEESVRGQQIQNEISIGRFGMELKRHEIDMRQAERDEATAIMNEQSLDTLKEWQANPQLAPPNIRNKPGVIDSMVIAKESAKTQLEGAQISNVISVGQFEMAIDKHQIEMTKAEREAALDLVNEQSMYTLEQWRDNPTSAPKIIQEKPGLLEAVLEARISNRTQLEAQSTALQIQKQTLDATIRERKLIALPPAQLEAIVEGKVAVPQGLEFGEVQERLNVVRTRDAALQGALIANKANNLQVTQELKAIALNGMTVNELSDYIDGMGESGKGVNIEGVDFTREEITQAFYSKAEAERERNNATFDRHIAVEGASGVQAEATAYAQGLHFALNPGKPYNPQMPYYGLPPAVGARAQTLHEKAQAALTLNNPDLYVKYTNELRDVLYAAKEEFIKNEPEEIRPYVREFIEHGRPVSTKAVNDYLLATAGNPALLAQDPVLDGIWSAFSSAIHTTAKQQAGGMPIVEGDIITFGGKKIDSAVVVEQAIRDSNVRQIANDTLFEYSVLKSFERLSQGSPDIWKRYYNPSTGRLSDAFYITDDDGNISFDMQSFTDTLAMDSQVLATEGKVQVGENLLDMIVHDIQYNGVEELRMIGASDVNASAMLHALYGNRPETAIRDHMNTLQGMAPMAVQSAAKQSRDLERIREAQQSIKQISPQLGMPDLMREQMINDPRYQSGAPR